jgi:arginase
MPKYWPVIEKKLIFENAESTVIHQSEDLNELDGWMYKKAFKAIRKNLIRGNLQINWGGDHGCALATVAAFCSLFSNGHVVWIDAHADLNTPESSPTGNFHGMPLSVLLGIGNRPSGLFAEFWGVLNPKKLIYVGLRDLDPYEKYLIKSYGICTYLKADIDKHGLDNAILSIRDQVSHRPLHISFDIDSIDPSAAPSTGVPSPLGFSIDEMHRLANGLFFDQQLKSMDVVEVNPMIGTYVDVFKTYQIAFKFVEQVNQFKPNYLGSFFTR